MPPKFGLVIPKKSQQQEKAQRLQRSRAAAALFNEDSDDDDEGDQIGGKAEVNKMLLREADSSRTAKNIQRELERAEKQDPSVFQYDEVYDDMAAARLKADPRFERYQHGQKKEAKYVKQLLRAAKERKRRDEARVERTAQREREQEGSEFADKEEFVTEAYKKKLLEIKETEALEKLEDERDAKHDVRAQADMSGFYRNLLTHNVAMGADERSTGLTAKIGQEIHDAETKKEEEEERQRQEGQRQRKERAKRAAEVRERLAKQVEYREVPGKKEELSDDQVAAKFARKADESTVADARKRALERRKRRKGPVPMDD